MIIALSTVESPSFSRFVSEFNNPSTTKGLIRGAIYVEHRIDKVDDLWVIRQKSILDQFLKLGIVITTGVCLLALFLKSGLLLNISLVCLAADAALLSPVVWFWTHCLRLFILGHRKSVKLASNTLLIEKLFLERENVANGSLSSIKE